MERRNGNDRRGADRRMNNGTDDLVEMFGKGRRADERDPDGSNHLDALIAMFDNEQPDAQVLDFDGWMRVMEKNTRMTVSVCAALKEEMDVLRKDVSTILHILYAGGRK